MDVADAADSLVARVDVVMVSEIVGHVGALVFPLERLYQVISFPDTPLSNPM